MKPKIITIVIALLFLGWASNFYWKNLRGVGPAIKTPSGDIAEAINTTGMPLVLPTGASISIFAKNLEAPRVMAWGPDGTLWVSIPKQGKIVSLRDADGDGTAETQKTILENLNRPHGIAFKCTRVNEETVRNNPQTDYIEECNLYIAESHRVGEYEYDSYFGVRPDPPRFIRDIAQLPDGGNHYTRTIMFLPYPEQSKLLISVGSSCNVCFEEDERRAKILVVDVNDPKLELKEFANGLRNSVFMALHPVDGKVWATEMGRDLLGDDIPPDEINIIEEGKNYGWPVCYGKNVQDADFTKTMLFYRNPCLAPYETPSHIDIPAHSAPLGLAFIPEEGWPEEFWHDLLVVYHGSWNRSVPTGYKIVRYDLDEKGNVLGVSDFISGWLKDSEALGRPVDILIQPGGVMYISDDKAGVIYRVAYTLNK